VARAPTHARRVALRPRLADFLGPRTGFQALDRFPLRGGLGFGLAQREQQALGVEPRQQLAGRNPVALARVDFRDPPAGVERQFHLPDVDVAVQRQLVGNHVVLAPMEEGAGSDRRGDRDRPYHLDLQDITLR
jgi:hypothetical protein